ncbi:MAG: hypothetical protein MUC36_13195 [Planctomycetes bacterium]|jgi:hypothetical protein|nr:hypothetical protein [Planctomycetota bacterium]
MASRSVLACLALLATSACAVMPRELNLAPFWFHRLDDDGKLLEWDAAWPFLHYERTPEGGDDFRVRPLYRRVTEPEVEASEHQFLWPLGRVRNYPEETSARLFPLWSWRSRPDEDGNHEVDWYLLFPFVWGGRSADGRENYFAVLPFFADIPDFLTYDRFRSVLFPLWVGLDKGGHRHDLFLWPFVGISSCAENGHRWFRVLPFYGHDIEPGRWDRRFVMWPFVTWSTENQDTEGGAVRSFSLWPLFGWRTGAEVTGWHALWPLFQMTNKQGHFFTLNLLWPLFRYHWNRADQNLTQWWLWPFVGRTTSDDQRAWNFGWPIVWWREYDDPDGHNEQQWIVPFFWRVVKQQKDGERETHVKVWPLSHHTDRRDADGAPLRGEWSFPSPLPGRDGNVYGLREAYGWIWELLRGYRHGPDDAGTDVLGRLYTTRSRQATTTASVPLLFNFEADAGGARTLRLFQFLPIPLGGGDAAPSPSR